MKVYLKSIDSMFEVSLLKCCFFLTFRLCLMSQGKSNAEPILFFTYFLDESGQRKLVSGTALLKCVIDCI